MWDDEWLSKGQIEEVLLPDLEIIDSHLHLWTGLEGRRDYSMDAFVADAEDGHRVASGVYVESRWGHRTDGPDHLKSVGETETVAALAEAGGVPTISGIVAGTDLAGPLLLEILDAHEEAGLGHFKGMRQQLAYDEDDRIPQPVIGPGPHLMQNEDWLAGLGVLGDRGMTFDAFVYHPQIPQLAAAARQVPQTSIVLDHLGAPVSIGRFEGRRQEVLAEWKDGITELSECPNVTIKIGGLGWTPMGTSLEQNEVPPTSRELADAWEPFVSHALATFGPSRCLAESNFPIDQKTFTFRTFWNVVKRLVADLDRHDQELVLAGAARQVYGL